ncbi:hypothetical protein KIH74_07270 [Kineosporia sp. J2-2]|uniref:DUF2269 family protein n=1 Tax=Kineosporia corallincola TaxID=2835133 RepID=A0ABS5TCB7_9ACTN|nr:hypothetical protein [Kineosporia corallincola]MBT0768720.1 hypothetical protein [Kineosporia corallincola]
MNDVYLFIHVATAILFIGAVAVATSLFPRYATGDDAAGFVGSGGHPAAVAMHRITRLYGLLAVISPVAGLILAIRWHALGHTWVWLSLVLVVIAWALLLLAIIPQQEKLLREVPADPAKARGRAAAFAGVFNLLWFVVLVLMYAKP